MYSFHDILVRCGSDYPYDVWKHSVAQYAWFPSPNTMQCDWYFARDKSEVYYLSDMSQFIEQAKSIGNNFKVYDVQHLQMKYGFSDKWLPNFRTKACILQCLVLWVTYTIGSCSDDYDMDMKW